MTKWRRAKASIPSQVASSDVETSITRTLSVGRATSASASAIRVSTPVPLWFAPGTTWLMPMFAIAAPKPALTKAPAPAKARDPISAPIPASRGAPTLIAISGGLVSLPSIIPIRSANSVSRGGR